MSIEMKRSTAEKLELILFMIGIVLIFSSSGYLITEKIMDEDESTMSYYDHTELEFRGLNSTQKKEAKDLAYNETKAIYHTKVKRIIFDGDPKSCERRFGEQCYGLTDHSKDEILIRWNMSNEAEQRITKLTLCHELLHSYFKRTDGGSAEDPVHMVLSEASTTEACYNQYISPLYGDYEWEGKINKSLEGNKIKFEYPLDEKYKK